MPLDTPSFLMVRAADASGHLMLWGLVWIGAFVACGIWPNRPGLPWALGNTLGAIGSIIIGIRAGRSNVESADGREGWRFFWLWISMFAFAGVWIWLLRPDNPIQLCAFICTAVMFLYVVMGLWFEAPFFIWLGLGITVLMIVGYQTLPQHFYFWMAGTGGGALFISGVYINRAWK